MNYKNEAVRLGYVFEATQKPEDYEMANNAFQELLAGGDCTNEDVMSYAWLKELNARYYTQQARALYEKIIKDEEEGRSGTYYGAHRQLTVLLSKMDKNHLSIERYKKMVAEEPDNSQVYMLLEQAYFWARQYDDAWLVLEAALKLEPENTGFLSEAGYVLKALGRYDEAIAHYDKAVASTDNDASALYGKACLYMDTHRYPEAIKAWQDVVGWLEARDFGAEAAQWPKAEIERMKKLL
jgi:tetratricopeptide (TPR) repeat protein